MEARTFYYVNSRNREPTEGSTNSNFYYKIDIPKDSKYDSVCVLQASIPKSYYSVHEDEHFTLVEDKSEIKITIPAGNYSRRSFANTLSNLLTSSSPHGAIYSVTYPTPSNAETGKLTYTYGGSTDWQPLFIISDNNDLYEHMGFNKGSINSFVDSILISTNVINLQQEDRIFIHSDICLNSADNVLQELYSTGTPDYSSIVYQATDVEAYTKDLSRMENNIFHFWLTDENNKPIDLNGQNMTLTLLIYKKNSVYQMIKDFIKLLIREKS